LACQPNEPLVNTVDKSFSISISDELITAGDPLIVTVSNPDLYLGPAKIILESALSTKTLNISIKKQSKFNIKGSQLEDAGLVKIMLLVGNELKDQKNILVTADDIVDPIELFTGPNTIWVNDIQESMVVALAKDQYGNAAREGEDILYQSRYPDREESKNSIEVKNQLAYQILDSDFKSGKIFSGTSDELSSGKEQRIDVIQLWPENIKIEVVDLLPYADSRQFYKLSTNVIKDVNGDIIPDGTLVSFKTRFKKRKSQYKAYTIDGVANVYIRNPEFPSNWRIYAYVGNETVVSNELELVFESNVNQLPINLTDKKVIVGPITSFIGQYIPDGTKVHFFNNGKRVTKESEEGYVYFSKPRDLVKAKIRVAGSTYEIENIENND